MRIRPETTADIDAITQVATAAFRTLEISHQTEHFIIHALRRAGALTVSLVAEEGGRVVGHIAFSPVVISDGSAKWYGMGPLSVLPPCQRQGIGTALVREGLSRLKALGGQGCVLAGHPPYYRRFGFEAVPGLICEGVPPEVFMALPFTEKTPHGTVSFHDAFTAAG
jgi:putative acetyltransferase